MLNFLIPVMTKLVDNLVPDTAAAAKIKADMEQNILNAQAQIDLSQIELNKEEAKSDSLLKSGWRPSVGWMCVIGLALVYVVFPIIECVAYIIGSPVPMPQIQTEALYTLLTAVLGMSGIRSYDKRSAAK